jgi:caffeoyl-CoA O-methyltransferase
MEVLDQALNAYLQKQCDPEPAYLAHIHRETYLKETMPHMISGHFQGRVLAMLSKLLAPSHILEIGTFTGYATLCLAEGLRPEGRIHTIEIEAERAERVMEYFLQSPFAQQIQQHIGDAMEIIPTLDGEFDMVFIDADKKNNLTYFELVLPRVRRGGLILLDNVLWKGKVVGEANDKQTKQVQELNEALAQDSRVEKCLLPIRDGLYLLRKK